MPRITDYTTLISQIDGAAGWLHRTDLTDRLPEFVQLAETDMQVRCKLVEFEASATVAVVAGVGTLPTDLVAMRSIYWDGDLKRPLRYITPDRFDSKRNESSNSPNDYTITGLELRISGSASGNAVLTYSARFTPLSDADPINSLITNYPDVYLYGTLYQAALYREDDAAVQKYGALFTNAVTRINKDTRDRKYAGATLQVRPR